MPEQGAEVDGITGRGNDTRSRIARRIIVSLTLTAMIWVGFFAFPARALDAPAIRSAGAGGVSSVNLAWSAVPGASGYLVFRGTSLNGGFLQIASVSGTGHTDTGLAGATTYYYKVAAFDGSGAGPESGAVSVSTHVTVRLDMAGGAIDHPESVSVPYGGSVQNPGNPWRAGYLFRGWSSAISGAGFFSFTETLTADITLSAVWSAVFSVHCYRNYDEEDGVAVSGGTYETGAAFPLPGIGAVGEDRADWTRSGYTFLGWSRSRIGGVTASPVTVSDADIHLYAQYSINRYNVTFDYGGEAQAVRETADYGSLLRKPEDPHPRASAVFAGWYCDGAEWDFADDTVPDRDITLTARWDENELVHTVTFHSGDERILQKAERSTKLIRPADPVREGYLFECWTLNGTEWDFARDVMPDHDILLEASFREAPGGAADAGNDGGERGFDEMAAAQTGNLFTDLWRGNVPSGGLSLSGCRSAVSMVLALFAQVLAAGALVLVVRRQKRPNGFRLPTTRLRGLFAATLGFFAAGVCAGSRNLSGPVVLFASDTLSVGFLFLLQCAATAIFLQKGLARGEWIDYRT